MEFEFDPDKDAANLAKHGVPLNFASVILADPHLVITDASRIEDGEERLKAIGMVEGRVWAIVYAMRGDVMRLISVRKGNPNDEKTYGQI